MPVSISGVTSLPAGAFPARVTLIREATGLVAGTTVASAAGAYSFAGVSAGNYAIVCIDPDGNYRAEASHVYVPPTGPTLSDEILADAPWAYWKLDELAGATAAADASGNGRTLTTISVADANRGKPSLAVDGDGTSMLFASGQLVNGDLTAFSGHVALSMAALVKRTTSTATAVLMHNGNTAIGNGQGQFLGVLADGSIFMQTFAGAWLIRQSAPGALAVGETALVGFAHDPVADTVTIYKNGSSIATLAHTQGLGGGASTRWTLGFGQGAAGTALIGYLDHAAVFAQSLPAARWLVHAQVAGLA